ncbi:MAG: ABC transporter ATP-binding protein [Planctomycetes bacterium]|nr:ABC transporter ATP-binding protein [Planctomycetota bacterium]MBI3835140.1 ABC transporter ATP-binding protein [Planctomycetota bacterium]
MLLKVENLQVAYGAIVALRGLNLTVAEGDIVTLIGANGAGKTTLLRTVSGLLRPKSGSILYQPSRNGSQATPSQNLARVAPHEIVHCGIVHVPEGRGIFANLTVAENLDLGAYLRNDPEAIAVDRESVLELFPRLRERYRQSSGTLSGGEQQMLAIARGLMARPVLLLLDEPSLGLAPRLVQQIFETIVQINQRGMTILLVEQNAHMALHVAKYAYCMETGRIVLEGPAKELAAHDEVKKAYLGG